MVRCAVHPDRPPKPGYAVCRHVMNGADVVLHVAPTPSELGHVVCGLCADDGLTSDARLLYRVAMALELHCADCVAYHLGARLPAAEPGIGVTVQ